MSSTYTGVGSNVSPSTSPTITVPSDGDSLAASSVNTALDKLMDYIAQVYGVTRGSAQANTDQAAKFAAAGGNSPVKGSLNLVPTTNAPSGTPDNGDMWCTSGGVVGFRANGNNMDLSRAFGQLLISNAQSFTANATDQKCTAIALTTGLTASAGGIAVDQPNSRFTITTPGYYLVNVQMSVFPATTNCSFKTTVYKNKGLGGETGFILGPVSGGVPVVNTNYTAGIGGAVVLGLLALNDTIELWAQISAGATQNVDLRGYMTVTKVA